MSLGVKVKRNAIMPIWHAAPSESSERQAAVVCTRGLRSNKRCLPMCSETEELRVFDELLTQN